VKRETVIKNTAGAGDGRRLWQHKTRQQRHLGRMDDSEATRDARSLSPGIALVACKNYK